MPRGAAANPFASLTAVACGSASACVAIGSYSAAAAPSQQAALLLTRKGSSWSVSKIPLPAGAAATPQVGLDSVACVPSTSTCVVTGNYEDTAGSGQGLLLTWSGSGWKAARAPLPAGAAATPNASVGPVTCPTATTCVATGEYFDGSSQLQGLLLSRSGSSWAASQAPVPAGVTTARSTSVGPVTCASPSSCSVAGSFTDSAGQHLMMLNGSGTAWTATETPLPAAAGTHPTVGLSGMACTSATCVTTGVYETLDGLEYPLLVTGSGSSWKARTAPLPGNASQTPASELNAVSCSASACVAAGTYPYIDGGLLGGLRSMLVTGTGSTWRVTETPLPAEGVTQGAAVDSISCPSVTTCVAVGSYPDIYQNHQGLLLAGPG